ncbi:MAG: hypothetical protein JXR73_19910 [Candidatus Omnitrophica bacterium]|nr:hypothetical protein [Candidatus Omnitrophota bacterium]
MIPSKTMVLLNQPEVKKRLHKKGPTIRNITPELRRFLCNPKTRFAPDANDRAHWEIMQRESAKNVKNEDVRLFLEQLPSHESRVLPSTDEELFRIIGMETLLRYILHVSVIRGLLKMDLDEDDKAFCHDVCDECMEDALSESLIDNPPGEKAEKDNPAPHPDAGLKIRDLIRNKYGR